MNVNALFLKYLFIPMAFAVPMKAPTFELKATREGSKLRVIAVSPVRHHFNVEAPAALTVGQMQVKPAPFDKSQAVFVIPEADARQELKISLFVCDDANTFCEKHVILARWNGTVLTRVVADASREPSQGSDKGATSVESGNHGFLVNEPQKALDLAREQNRPLMIDFYGIWCPPCNEYDAKVFSRADFSKQTEGFIKLKLDVDQKVSWPLKSKHHVGGYPTILFTTPEGDEISRIVGYRPTKSFYKAVGEAYAQRGVTFAKLQQAADSGDVAASERLGVMLLEKEKFADAEKYLARAKDPVLKRRRWEARAKGLKTAGGPPYLSALQEALKATGGTTTSLELLQALSEAHPEQKNAYLEKIITTSKALIASPEKLENEDYTPADLWVTIADALSELGRDSESKVAWLASAREFEKRSVGPQDRGNLMEAAWGYWNGGQVEKAEKLYTQLQKAYPTEFTYYYYHSRMYLALKKYKEAREKAQKSFEYSYGDNRLRVAEAYAKALRGESRQAEAKKLIESVLKDLVLPDDASVRTHRYAKALRELEKTL